MGFRSDNYYFKNMLMRTCCVVGLDSVPHEEHWASKFCFISFQGATVECFEQAYEGERGCLCPTMDQMRNLVVRNRARSE